MARRSIVVEGTMYHWETNGYNISIILPDRGGTRRFSVAEEIGGGFCVEDSPVPITPRDIASLIYRDILGKPMPARSPAAPVARPKPPAVLHWATAAEMPRTYLVQAAVALPQGGEAVFAVEVHETAETAREAAARLGGPDTARLVAAALAAPGAVIPHRRRGDESHGVERLVAWLRTLPLAGDAAPVLQVSVSEVPFKIAA